jgi:hypothetical protein
VTVNEADAWGTKTLFEGASLTHVVANNILLKANAMNFTSATTMNLHAATNLDAQADGTAKVRGSMVEVKAAGTVDIEGSLVTIN